MILGSGESTYSVKWMPNSPNTLVAGATKWIRLFDIRSIIFFIFFYISIFHTDRLHFKNFLNKNFWIVSTLSVYQKLIDLYFYFLFFQLNQTTQNWLPTQRPFMVCVSIQMNQTESLLLPRLIFITASSAHL